MQVVEYRPERHEYAWTFGGVAPTHRITPGTCLKLWTEDAFSGRLTSTTHRASAVLDMTEVNPQTGPFYVEGAEPGDTLALHIARLTPARDWGASSTIPSRRCSCSGERRTTRSSGRNHARRYAQRPRETAAPTTRRRSRRAASA